MAREAKTKPTKVSLDEFLSSSVDPARHDDCRWLASAMTQATGEKPVLWGSGIVGFGLYRYKYASGAEGDWPIVGFAPRKNDLTVYIMPGFERYQAQLAKLGKHKTAKVCLYIKKLADVDTQVLNEIIADSVQAMSPNRIKR
jgi:hypothetical protein